MKLSGKGLSMLFDKYVLKKEKPVKKTKRSDLSVKKSTTMFDSIGYSVTQKRELKNNEVNRKKHSVVIGSSGSGKTVLLKCHQMQFLKFSRVHT